MHATTRAHHHVDPLRQQRIDQLMCVLRRVGSVAVGHDIDVGIDVREHPTHDVTLALAAFAHDGGTGKERAQRGAVGRIVVVDIDSRTRQRRLEPGYDRADRLRFVVARQEDCYVQRR